MDNSRLATDIAQKGYARIIFYLLIDEKKEKQREDCLRQKHNRNSQ